MMELPQKLIELDFVIIEFYEKYTISKYREGIVLTDADVAKVQDLIEDFYDTRPFGYISNRVNDYSRNLSPQSYNRQLSKLFAMAVVYKTKSTLQIANFEKFFIKAPFRTFQSLADAKQWMMEMSEQN